MGSSVNFVSNSSFSIYEFCGKCVALLAEFGVTRVLHAETEKVPAGRESRNAHGKDIPVVKERAGFGFGLGFSFGFQSLFRSLNVYGSSRATSTEVNRKQLFLRLRLFRWFLGRSVGL